MTDAEIFLGKFEEYCDEFGKLFIPEPNSENVMKSLVNYHKKFSTLNVLDKCIKQYIKKTTTPRVIDLALNIADIRSAVEFAVEDDERIRELMKETQKRVKGDG